MIIESFFINLSILVTFLFIYTQLSSKKPLTMNSSASVKILSGLFGGVLSNILMQFSIPIDTVIFDLRHIPLLAIAYFGGALPASITVILTVGGRFFISIDTMSYLSAVVSIAGALFACLFSRTKYPINAKVFIIVSFNNLILSVFYLLMSQQSSLTVKVLMIYWIISYIAAYLSFYLLYYIRHTQTLFKKYQQDSVTDWLTGLNNHRKFDQVFNKLVDQTKKKQQNLSLLYVDIDHFKRVNDRYGHVEGDVVLSTLGMVLKKSMKDNDVVCRIGGEEFSLLFINCSLKESHEIAERIRKNVEGHIFQLESGEDIQITISIGVACYPETTLSGEQLRADADEALYRAKNTGRNRVCVAGQDT